MRKLTIILTMAMLVVAACTTLEDGITPFAPRDSETLFVDKSQIGVYNGGVSLFAYAPSSQQLSHYTSPEGEGERINEFIIQSDDLATRLAVSYPHSLTQESVGSVVTIEIEATGVSGVRSGSLSVEVAKFVDSTHQHAIWFWSASQGIGYIVYTQL